MTDQPSRYSIEALLNKSVQPFENIDDGTLAAIRRDLAPDGELAVPIVVGADGTLIDGHQRLQAMRKAKRTFVDARDVRVLPDATAENALEWSIKLNVRRRHLTTEQKAALARELQRTRGWSQARIAKAFAVSRPAVTQWLGKHPDESHEVTEVEGVDGIVQPVTHKRKAAPKPAAHFWDLYRGEGFRLTETLIARLQDPDKVPTRPPLTEMEHDKAVIRLGDLAWAIEAILHPDDAEGEACQ